MYFEFAGVPGSGKSTLSSALESHFHSLQKNAISRDDALKKSFRSRNDGTIKNMFKRLPSRIWQPLIGVQSALPEFATMSSRHLKFIAFISKTLSQSDLPELLIESIWKTTVRTFSEIELINNHLENSEQIIMDEAFAQRCFTLFGYMENAVPDELINQYAQLAPISNHIFFIITDPATCADRFMKRYQSHPVPYKFELNKEELTVNFKSGNRILGHLANELEKQGKQVYRIDGNCDVNECVETVCNTQMKSS